MPYLNFCPSITLADLNNLNMISLVKTYKKIGLCFSNLHYLTQLNNTEHFLWYKYFYCIYFRLENEQDTAYLEV